MKPYMSKGLLVFVFTFAVLFSAAYPDVLAKNKFLVEFIDYDFLSFLGIVLSISIASLLQLSISVSQAEQFNKDAKTEIIAELRSTTVWMVGIFAAGFVLVLIRPMITGNLNWLSFLNGFAIFLIVFYLVILLDTIIAAFELHSTQ